MGERGYQPPEYRMPNEGEDESEPSTYAGKEPPHEVGSTMRTSTGRTVRLMRYDMEKGLYHVMEFGKDAIRPAWRVSPDNLTPLEGETTK